MAQRTGLDPTVEILAGAHDSNANFFRYKAAGMADHTVLSTGTWMIGFNRGRRLEDFSEARAMVANVDVDGSPIASTLTMTGREYAILAGELVTTLHPTAIKGLRLAVPQNYFLDGLDGAVASTFDTALRRLAAAGAHIIPTRFPEIDEIAPANAKGGFSAAEAFAWHRDLLARDEANYDPRVSSRIKRGATMLAADYVDLIAFRADLIARFNAATRDYDAILTPTCPLLPPRIEDLAEEAAYTTANMMQLRNPTVMNFLDRCSISLPANRPGEPPVGLMITGETMGDPHLFRLAAAIEATLAA